MVPSAPRTHDHRMARGAAPRPGTGTVRLETVDTRTAYAGAHTADDPAGSCAVNSYGNERTT